MCSWTGSSARQLRMVAIIALLVGSSAALARAPSSWDGLAESAALKLGTAARQLAVTAGTVGGEGRIGHLSVLRSDAEELVRRADALARMAQEPLPEEVEAEAEAQAPIPGKRPANR